MCGAEHLSSSCTSADPVVDSLLEDVQRTGPSLQDEIVKSSNVECRAQPILGTSPHLVNANASNHIATGLTWPCSIAVALLTAFAGGHACLLLHVCCGALDAPVEMMDACINHPM